MADTMKFGPEWLRALSDGPSTAPSATAKFKLAEHRYGLEEMLALYQETFEPPEHLSNFRSIYVEEAQKPLALLPPSEEEQRIIAQGVNSTLITRGRGGMATLRGGRGANIDRSRGRGRGRGEAYPPRSSLENGDMGGGFGRPRGPNKDGWEEVGRKLDRNYSRPYDEVASGGNVRFNRSISDNWRERGTADEDEEGDWRKAGREKWSHRSSWREPGKGVTESDRRNGGAGRGRGFNTDDRGRRPDVWDSEDMPEWAEDGSDEMGSFDASGAFVSNKEHHPNNQLNRGSQSKEHSEDSTAQTVTKPQKRKEKEEENGVKQSTKDKAPPHNGIADSPDKSKDSDSWSSTSDSQPAVALPTDADAASVPHEAPAVNDDEAIQEPEQNVDTLVTDTVTQKTERNTEHLAGDDEAVKWFYTDPQGEMQGPFSAEEMAQWFSAGYFTMNLLVKRGCDQQFHPLGELIKRWGRVPFLPGAAPPPVVQSPLMISEPSQTLAQPLPLHLPTITSMASLPQPAQPIVSSPHAPSLPLAQGTGVADQLLVQHQLLLRNQLLQQQLVRQIQMQALAQLQLQEQEGFKTLDPVQQRQLNFQLLQSHPLILQQVQQLQQAQQLQVSQGQAQATLPVQPMPPLLHSSQANPEMELTMPSPSFQRSISQPAATTERQGDFPSIWGTISSTGAWSQPGSVWDLENGSASVHTAEGEILRQDKEVEQARLAEEERRRQEAIQKQQEELRRQQEELQRERQQMLREKEELERQKQMELQRLEEVRRQHEEEVKRRELEEAEKRRWAEEEERRRLQEEQRRKEEERRREEERRKEGERKREEEGRREEERKRQEEARWQEEKRKQEELRQKAAEDLALQELKRQEEIRQQEEAERQRQHIEVQKKQELQKQQQEALRRLQQQREQIGDIQLPPSANWARQQQPVGAAQQSLTAIQEEEQRTQQQLELQRQIMRLHAEQLAQQQLQQQQQQQQQKSWANNVPVSQSARVKTLAEIQEEQAKQLREEQEKVVQQQHHQVKNMSLSMAAVWGSGEPKFNPGSAAWSGSSVWGSETSMSLWGASYNSAQPMPVSNSTSSGKKSGKESNAQSSDFPALINQKSSSKNHSNNKPPPTKSKKEEEAVQRLFQQSVQKKDDFTVWCEAFLQGMEVTVDIETFVSFLQAVDSPYEVHDYVRNYLGEGKDAKEFAKQFLEKRSQFKNKARMEKRQEEESIWGPAPAVTPREPRRLTQQAPPEQSHGEGGKSKNKKKKKMQKMDGSNLLSFTVEKDPNRKNAGEIESVD